MNKNIKRIFFVTTLLILLLGIATVNANDVSNDTTMLDSIDSTDSITTTDNNINNQVTKTFEKKENNIKQNTAVNYTITSETDYDDLFTTTTTNVYALKDSIEDDSNITFETDITKTGKTYIINKAVNIIGNDKTITLNTVSGSYLGNETGSSFIFEFGAAGSNVTNINFYNTQVIIRNTSNIVFDNIDQTVYNQNIGQGIGTFSIRADSSYITVENSRFSTTNNGGSSTLVLASANHCTIDHNNITGVGNVGNLLYLTTYNIEGVELTDIELNSFNTLSYNNIVGPSTSSAFRYGIALTGHDNEILYNNISMGGQGITTQWGYTDPATPEIGDNSERYKGNTYIGNTLTGGSSFKATNNSTITGNTFNGVLLVENCTFRENTATTVNVTGQNNYLCDNTISLLNVGESATNTSKCSSNSISYINGTLLNVVTISSSNCQYCNEDDSDATNLKNKNLKSDDENATVIYITDEESFNKYMDINYGRLLDSIFTTKNSTYIVYIGYFPENMTTFILNNNPKAIRSSTLKVYGINNITITNAKVTTDCGARTFVMGNFTFNYNQDQIIDGDLNMFTAWPGGFSRNFTIENITINSNRSLKMENNSYKDINPLFIRNDFASPMTINNITINMQTESSYIDWDTTKIPYTIAIRYFDNYNKNANIVLSNTTVNFNETSPYYDNGYSTIYGVYLGSNTTFINNTINIKGSECVYGIVARGSNNTINNNIINSECTGYYACGIDVESSNIANNILENNYINVTAGYGENENHNPHVAYGALIIDYSYQGFKYQPNEYSIENITYTNNTIICNAGQSYGVEIFGGNNLNISDNYIDLTSRVPMGIGAIGENVTIAGNTIIANGTNNATENTVDYLTSRTVGVYTRYTSVGLNITDNNITMTTGRGIYIDNSNSTVTQNNNITVNNYTYTVELIGNSNTVTNNYLKSDNLNSDASVLNNGTDNIIENNLPKVQYKLTVDTTEFTIGQNATISATIYLGDEEVSNITKGKVVFKVNGKTLKDSNNKVIYAKIVNGTATIENYEIPESWNKEGITIEAVYSGSSQCTSLRSQKENITIIETTTPSITTEDITTTIGSTISLKAQVTGSEDLLSNAKVVFKVNGKTLKDTNGKVIYAQITNGEVNVEYTLPENFKAKTYTLTATLICPNYDRLTDTKTLEITA